jgi:Fe-S-cluster containining protein
MRDGSLRLGIKVVARMIQAVDLWFTRLWLGLRGEPHFLLDGDCSACGACCEHPTVQLPRPLFLLRSYRSLLIAWHRRVNGFVLERADRRLSALVFRCTHFDPATRRCDSYGSRPLMCRDYPRALLFHAVPRLFEDCTHRAVYRHGPELERALEAQGLAPEQLAELRRRLGLGDQ